MEQRLDQFWDDIPVGKENAVSYDVLCARWFLSKRHVRRILEQLSCIDNGDNYILIRSSKGAGFYRTDDPLDIAEYKRECHGRAMSVLTPIKKMNRVLHSAAQESINISFTNNIQLMRSERNMTQKQLCTYLEELGYGIDIGTLSKIENNYVLPTYGVLRSMACIFECEPFELIGMHEYVTNRKNDCAGLQAPLF